MSLRALLATSEMRCGIAFTFSEDNSLAVKLVKKQINGMDRVVLRESASPDHLAEEAARLHRQLGYDVKLDKTTGTYLLTHLHYHGKFVLSLERD